MLFMRRGVLLIKKIGLLVLGSNIFFSCTKMALEPIASPKGEVTSFHVSASKLELLQGNESNFAVSFRWQQHSGVDAVYTIEAAVCGSSFEDPIELTATTGDEAGLTVKELNTRMSKLVYPNTKTRVEFRVREDMADRSKHNPVYSSPIAMELTTYKNYTLYDDQSGFKIPGNYQGWNLASAPKIVSVEEPGQYEGYLNFPNEYPQLLMVKGSTWQTLTTYSYIGADKFGFGGSVISVFGGAGTYLFRANTGTNQWSYTKINKWGILGTAVPGTNAEPVMTTAGGNQVWSVTTDLVKGNFRIRANNSNTISFGQKATDEMGVPSYKGDNIVIRQAGNYTIKLELQVTGNYAYSILKNS
jgi:hypothetical protein